MLLTFSIENFKDVRDQSQQHSLIVKLEKKKLESVMVSKVKSALVTTNRLNLVLLLFGSVIVGCFLLSIVNIFVRDYNQHEARNTLRKVKAAQDIYKSHAKIYGHDSDLVSLGLVSQTIFQGSLNGYVFRLYNAGDSYFITATPKRSGVFATGRISYYMNETGSIRGDRRNGHEATEVDPVLFEK